MLGHRASTPGIARKAASISPARCAPDPFTGGPFDGKVVRPRADGRDRRFDRTASRGPQRHEGALFSSDAAVPVLSAGRRRTARRLPVRHRTQVLSTARLHSVKRQPMGTVSFADSAETHLVQRRRDKQWSLGRTGQVPTVLGAPRMPGRTSRVARAAGEQAQAAWHSVGCSDSCAHQDGPKARRTTRERVLAHSLRRKSSIGCAT